MFIPATSTIPRVRAPIAMPAAMRSSNVIGTTWATGTLQLVGDAGAAAPHAPVYSRVRPADGAAAARR